MFFEDFAVGQQFTAGPRLVTAADLEQFTRLSGADHPMHTSVEGVRRPDLGEPVLPGSFGAAVAAGLWSTLGLVNESVVAAVGETWSYRQPIRVGDEVTLDVTIVRLRETSGEENGLVTRHNELRDGNGAVMQSGTATSLIRASGARPRSIARDVGTVPWGRALAAALGERTSFTSAVASWDGTIGLRAGEHEVHLRIYSGRIIDVTRRAPRGATFTFGADDRTWADVLTAPESRFGARLLTGEFRSSGDPYEYLRLTKALEILVDVARELAAVEAIADRDGGKA